MADIPKPLKPGDKMSAAWLNNVANLAMNSSGLQGKGYADANGVYYTARNPSPIKGYGKHTADIAQGLHAPPIEAMQYRSPAWGDISRDQPIFIDWAWLEIPADTYFYYEEEDGKIHATPLECA